MLSTNFKVSNQNDIAVNIQDLIVHVQTWWIIGETTKKKKKNLVFPKMPHQWNDQYQRGNQKFSFHPLCCPPYFIFSAKQSIKDEMDSCLMSTIIDHDANLNRHFISTRNNLSSFNHTQSQKFKMNMHETWMDHES